jgi:hypothetical protein
MGNVAHDSRYIAFFISKVTGGVGEIADKESKITLSTGDVP